MLRNYDLMSLLLHLTIAIDILLTHCSYYDLSWIECLPLIVRVKTQTSNHDQVIDDRSSLNLF